jgi:hypothetical protein
MKSLVVFVSAMTVCGAAHAELLAKRGAMGTLSVQYEYSATGSNKDKSAPVEWRVQRTIKLVIPLVADAPSETSSLRPANAADDAETGTKLGALQTTMAPTVADMMKIAERCNDDDACIERALQGYGETMDKATLEKGRAQAEEVGALMGLRYQQWRPLAQQGTYAVDETYRFGIAGAACKAKPKQRCTREETRRGAGNIPRATSAVAPAVTFEVDNGGKNALIKLPAPPGDLAYTRVVTSDHPDEKTGTSTATVPAMAGEQKLVTAPLAGDLRAASGTQTYALNGKAGEGGTMKVTWQFALQK